MAFSEGVPRWAKEAGSQTLKLRNLGWPGLCSALLLTLGLLGALLYWQHSQQSQRVQLADSGQALASSAARQAVGPTANQDLISLQVLLREFNRHPDVVGATIHDVENRLMVQSGSIPGSDTSRASSHRASIALDDEIAGHLELFMASPHLTPTDVRFFGVWSLVVLMSAGLPWLTKLRKPKTKPATTEAEQDPLPEEPTPSVSVRLSLQLLNLPRLFEQLNRPSFDKRLFRLERQLQGILALYGGAPRWVQEAAIDVDFEGGETHDCAFRALCAAWLLEQLLADEPGPKLQLKARVSQRFDPEYSSLSEQLIDCQEAEHQRGPGVYVDTPLLNEQLQQHLDLSETSGELTNIKPPYKALLEKQRGQLRELAITA